MFFCAKKLKYKSKENEYQPKSCATFSVRFIRTWNSYDEEPRIEIYVYVFDSLAPKFVQRGLNPNDCA